MVQDIFKQHGQIIFLRIEFVFFIFKIPRKNNLLQFIYDPDNRFLVELVDCIPPVDGSLTLVIAQDLIDKPADFPLHIDIHKTSKSKLPFQPIYLKIKESKMLKYTYMIIFAKYLARL